jgi:RimJ/RimL family protein N-acetyltransferase
VRRLAAGDAVALARIWQDDETMRWSHPGGCSGAEEAAAAIVHADEEWGQGEAAGFAIVGAVDDIMVGGVHVTFYGDWRAGIGYDLAPEVRGRGLATKALSLVSDWAFGTFADLVRQELWILPGNDRSLRVAERAGFQREGILRSRLPFAGEFRDVICLSRLRSDPKA